MEKVRLPKEVADALELMKAKGAPLNEIVERHVDKEHINVNGWEYVAQLSTDSLIRALYIGYEVEQTPEESIKLAFQSFLDYKMEPFDYGAKEHTWFQAGVRTTLNILGIKIEGVNA